MIDQIIRNKYYVFVIFSILSILTYFKCFSVGLLSDDYGYFAGVSNDGWSSIGKNFNDPFFLPLSHIIQLNLLKFGFFFLISLMIFVTLWDIRKLFF